MLKGVVWFVSRMQTHIVAYQAAPRKAASELWKHRGEKSVLLRKEDWKRDIKGECLPWTLKNWLDFSKWGM